LFYSAHPLEKLPKIETMLLLRRTTDRRKIILELTKV
jgi:hypothetical protein